ncbi:MAG: diguanylate cyclase, partial [Patescibacteria group bacterium]
GVGGVTRPEDYKEYRDAGADVVMSATGAMWNPYLAKEIKDAYPNG